MMIYHSVQTKKISIFFSNWIFLKNFINCRCVDKQKQKKSFFFLAFLVIISHYEIAIKLNNVRLSMFSSLRVLFRVLNVNILQSFFFWWKNKQNPWHPTKKKPIQIEKERKFFSFSLFYECFVLLGFELGKIYWQMGE